MKCPQCKDAGQTSKLFPDAMSMTTDMAFSPGYYDEGGAWVAEEDPNYRTRGYSCSNGHRFAIVSQGGKSWYGGMFEEPRRYVEAD